MNKIILKSIFVIFALLTITAGSTNAYFSDSAVITGNVFSTGTWAVTHPPVPVHLSPVNGIVTNTANQQLVDWSTVTDDNPPITYIYQSSHSPLLNPNGSFVSPVYTSGILTNSQIPTPGTPPGTYYWHVKAVDSLGHESAWSSSWVIIVN